MSKRRNRASVIRKEINSKEIWPKREQWSSTTHTLLSWLRYQHIFSLNEHCAYIVADTASNAKTGWCWYPKCILYTGRQRHSLHFRCAQPHSSAVCEVVKCFPASECCNLWLVLTSEAMMATATTVAVSMMPMAQVPPFAVNLNGGKSAKHM